MEPAILITNVRIIPAARERVFSAFETPAKLALWWGPHGFANEVPTFDFQVGGEWRIVMRAQDGATYDNRSRFLEIVRPEKIVYEHLQPMHHFTMTMTYRDVGREMTELAWNMALEKNAEHERLKEFIFKANEQNFDRLCAFLDNEKNNA
jgi:uncharacterized protein YndB with AHSA1/START domain